MSNTPSTPISAQIEAQEQALLNGPAGPPPPGLLPNFKDPPNLDTYVDLTIALCLSLSTISVALRMYTKRFIIRSLAYEDYFILVAWIGQIGYIVPSTFTVRYGAGTHMWDVQLKTFLKMLYWVNVTAVVYGFVIIFVKFSILLQYLRIFAPTRKGNMFIFVGAWLTIFAVLFFYLTDSMFEIFKCTPRKKIWNPLMKGGHCFSQYGTFQATGIFNVVSDFVIWLLPMPSVWKLKLPLKRKLLMTFIFGAGFFACVASILRTYYTWRLVNSSDMSYWLIPMGLWGDAELSTGVFISCLPVLPKFFQQIAPKIWKTLSIRSTLRKSSTNRSADEPRLLEPVKQRPKVPSENTRWEKSTVEVSIYDGGPSRLKDYARLEDGIVTVPQTRIEEYPRSPESKPSTTRSYSIY